MSDMNETNPPVSENGLGEQPHSDPNRQPELIPSQMGTRWVSLNALVEQIETAFVEEHGSDSPELLEADTPSKRLQLVLATANYVFAVESVQLSQSEKADIISKACSSLFGYGPLDELFANDRITTISLQGADKASVRYGHGELEPLNYLFQSEEHYQRIMDRLIQDAGAELHADHPYLELGLRVNDRPICVNLVAPPVTLQLSADIRLHPKQIPTWDSLIAAGQVTTQAIQLLKAIIVSPHGLLIIGEPESGKTTLLSLLMNELADPSSCIAVERAGEARLPAGMHRLTTKWRKGDAPQISFGEQILHALEQKPSVICLDEVRADEPQTIAPLLQMSDAPRQIWSFRGATFAKRLQSALGMLARRAEVGGGEALVRPLYDRLPFVVALNRVGGQVRVWSIGEWQFKHMPDYPTYTPLMQIEDGQFKLTGETPSRELPLPPEFWT